MRVVAAAAFALAVVGLLLEVPAAATGADPRLERAVEFVQRLGAEAQELQRRHRREPTALRHGLERLFDRHFALPDFAQASLGRYWPTLTAAEQGAFRQKLGQRLKRLYAGQLAAERPFEFSVRDRRWRREAISVRLSLRLERTHELKLLLVPRAQGFAVLDVVLADVSLLRNCRGGFVKTLRTGTVADLFQRLDRGLDRGKLP